ncbi:MAG TPA: C25 family cysteine peptidase, partial [Cyclobacteriaceae bacterium]|nr:C25 family cysteine peptidase [Cyclobacteriaceae bacterium]
MVKAFRVKIIAVIGFWLASFLSHPLSAQYSNEWINFTQTYYKIPVSKNGIYKITYSDLQAAGVPLAGIDPRRINIFHRGTEQAIFVQGQADAQFDPADYIEFYGQRNDGTLDTDLYIPGAQPHTFYNLYSDTTAYFLTWNPLPVQGRRMTSFFETNSSLLPVQTFHRESRLDLFTSQYSGGLTISGEIQDTRFDTGEGWTGPLICTQLSGCTGLQDFVVDNVGLGVSAAGLPQLEIQMVGRELVTHLAQIYAGTNSGALRLVASANFSSFDPHTVVAPIAWSDIGANGKMTVRVQLTPTGSKDLISVSYIKVNFPQQYNLNGSVEKVFNTEPDALNKSYVEFINAPAGARIWDITDVNDVGTIGSVSVSGGIGAIVPSTSQSRKLYVTASTLSSTLSKVGFRSISPSLAKFVIISHRSLMQPALGYGDAVKAYASYRASTAGGGYDTLTVAMDQLYNQFNYGETSPRAIYQFMKYLVNGGDPRYLFLVGKGLEVSQGYNRKTHLPTDFKDLVPAAGMPGADMAFTAGLAGTTFEPAVATGRLTASTAAQVAAYLNKVKETETAPYDDLWRKDLLHLSGGINAGEPALFRQYVDGFKNVAESYYLGGNVQTISKQSLNVELINVKDQVNKGLNLITFFGHSGPGTIDIDIGYVSDPIMGYHNVGKYPAFLINGCNAGRFFDNRVTFGEDWMLTASKGAKAFIAHSYFGFPNTLKDYSDTFYSVAYADSAFMRKGIGEIQKETARRYLTFAGTSISPLTQAQQMVLLGDPAVQLFGALKPDYEVSNGSLAVISLDGKPVNAQSTSFAVDVRIRNFGRALTG